MRWRISETWGERSGHVLVAFLVGVVIRSVDPLRPWRGSWTGSVLVVATCGAIMTWRVLPRSFRYAALLTCMVCVGIWRFEVMVPTLQDGLMPWMGQVVALEGVVTSVERSRYGISALVVVRAVEGHRVGGPARLVRVPAKVTGIRPNDEVQVNCTLTVPVVTPGSPRRRLILARQGIWTNCGRAKLAMGDRGSDWHPGTWLFMWRDLLDRRIERALPYDEASLLKGILYGERALSPDLQEAFRTAGLTHIIAVSGSNVSIVINAVFAVILGLGLMRRRAFWVASVLLAVFVGFVGFSASVLRAACMGWLALAGRETGRLVSTRRLLLVSAVILCLYDPWQLVYDAGFALSFLATIGLLEVMPRIEPWLQRVPMVLGLRESIATTLATTLVTAPYTAWMFERLSLAGLLTNVVALPIVPWAMLWGACSAVFGDVVHPYLHWPATGALRALIQIGRWSRVLPWLDMKW